MSVRKKKKKKKGLSNFSDDNRPYQVKQPPPRFKGVEISRFNYSTLLQ